MSKLRLEVLFGGRDKLSPALKIIAGSSTAASRALKKTTDQLKDLERQQKQVATFKKLKEDVKQASIELERHKKTVQSLKQQLATNPNSKLSAELKKTEAEVKRLNKVVSEGRPKLIQLRQELNNAGLKATDLGQHQEELKNKIKGTNTEIDRQRNHLKNLNNLQVNTQKWMGHTRTAAMYGAGAVATGVGAIYSMRKPIEESKGVDVEQNRIASLGLGKDATKEAIEYAKAMKTFGTSTLDNLTLVRDGVTAFADVHHAQLVAPMLAKMKFANEAMYGNEHGAENEKKFMDMLKVIEMRNGLKSEAAFKEQANIIQQVITATGGRVQPEEWLNVIKTGGIAAKGFDNKAFYYKLEPLVQEMGGHRVGTSMMSAYQNLYQGRTTQRAANNLDKFGLIGDRSKVKHNKTGDLSYLDIGAIKGADLFKKDQFAWMEQVLVPALNAKGITKEGDVVDAIGSIFSNRTASNLFAQMYMQREQIHKNAKLNAGAFNIEQLDTQARGSTTGKELEAKAKLHDAYLRFGQTILPVYTKALEMAAGAFQTFTGWMEKNPTLAKALGVGLLVLAGSLIAIGGALVVFSPLILSMLSLRLIMASTSAGGTALTSVFSKIPSVFGFIKSAMSGIGSALFSVGRLMMANPMLLVFAAIAIAVVGVAYLIYQHWGGITAWFSEKWNSIKTGASTAWESVKTGASEAWLSITTVFSAVGLWFSARWQDIKNAFNTGISLVSALILNWSPLGLFYTAFSTVLSWFGVELPQKFSGFGSMLIDGLINGIKSGFAKLKSVWSEVTDHIPNVFTKRMDIHSPSRVMAALGGHVMGGIRVGLEQGFPGLKDKFNQVLNVFNPNASTAEKINVAPALAKISPAPQFSGSSRGDVIVQGDTITIHLHAAPGQNLQQLQNMVESVLNKRDQQKQARIRSSFLDQL
jgi:hypothetical protein